MQELTNQIAQQLPDQSIILNTRVIRIKRLENHWEVTTRNELGQEEQNTFDEVICTLPAHKLPEIEWIGLKRTELSKIWPNPPISLALVFHGYEKQSIKHPLNGFGFLFRK